MNDRQGSGNDRQDTDDGTIVVKFMAKKLTAATAPSWRRQLPNRESQWGRCRFVFDQDCRSYDWLVAYDDLSPVAGEKFSFAGSFLTGLHLDDFFNRHQHLAEIFLHARAFNMIFQRLLNVFFIA